VRRRWVTGSNKMVDNISNNNRENNSEEVREQKTTEEVFRITVTKDAEKALPQLSHIMSFPTTIFIDKKGVVRKIRTGYSGPATGEAYSVFVKEMNYFTEMLITE